MLGDVSDQIEQIVAVVFENYKSLDESLLSGLADVFTSATGVAAPSLSPALMLYKLLNDILSSEAQLKLCRYFQVLNIITACTLVYILPPFFRLIVYLYADCSKEEV